MNSKELSYLEGQIARRIYAEQDRQSHLVELGKVKRAAAEEQQKLTDTFSRMARDTKPGLSIHILLNAVALREIPVLDALHICDLWVHGGEIQIRTDRVVQVEE